MTEREAFDRLIRIMGTFDLATGHANTFEELLDSLEAELRDVLGYYREALKTNTQTNSWTPQIKPLSDEEIISMFEHPDDFNCIDFARAIEERHGIK